MNTYTLHNTYITILAFALFALLCLLAFPSTSQAQTMGVFGGRSDQADFCSCSLCFKVDVGEPRSGEDLMWCPFTGTSAYRYYNVQPDAWQLGTYGLYMVCLQISYPYCEEDGGGPLMLLSGTSAY
jgi:hypothetical protein